MCGVYDWCVRLSGSGYPDIHVARGKTNKSRVQTVHVAHLSHGGEDCVRHELTEV